MFNKLKPKSEFSRNFLSLISAGESQTIEFKTSFQKEVIESVVAFSNAKGGKIFIGVKDDGSIQGLQLGKETLKDWINQAFYLTGDIEKYGSGYIRVREEIQEYPTMLFEYKESGDGYFVKLSYAKQKTTREQILELLKEDKKLTRNTLAQFVGVSPDTIKQHLSKLQNDKLLKRVA